MTEPIIQDAEAQVAELNDECERLRASVETWRMMYKADCKPEVIANLSAELAERDATITRLLSDCLEFIASESSHGPNCRTQRYQFNRCNCGRQDVLTRLSAALAEQPSIEPDPRDATIARLRRELQVRIAACETSGCGLSCTTDGCGIADALRGS